MRVNTLIVNPIIRKVLSVRNSTNKPNKIRRYMTINYKITQKDIFFYCIHFLFLIRLILLILCGCSLVVKLQPSKLMMRVRFPSPAQLILITTQYFVSKRERSIAFFIFIYNNIGYIIYGILTIILHLKGGEIHGLYTIKK